MSDEPSTDLSVVAAPVKEAFKAFAKEDGRELKLEIEPGTFLLANTGAVVAGIQDIVSTGKDGCVVFLCDRGSRAVAGGRRDATRPSPHLPPAMDDADEPTTTTRLSHPSPLSLPTPGTSSSSSIRA